MKDIFDLDSPPGLMSTTAAFGRRVMLAAMAALLTPAWAQERSVERIATPFTHDGRPVELELVISRPPGPGPFPTVMFNHGSTGRGDDPSRFTQTFAPGIVAKFLNDRGWMVVFPQRRGRGKSGGIYDEGFEPDRSGYSCLPRYSLPGIERALQDLDAALQATLARADVNAKLVVVSGVSRGGILSLAHAARHPAAYRGAINFVGGWVGEACAAAYNINLGTFERSAAFTRETLWLYGEDDAFYSIHQSRRNFDAFVSAGGRGTFHVFNVGPGKRGHLLLSNPGLWSAQVDAYLAEILRTADR